MENDQLASDTAASAPVVDVCICTYRRPFIHETLAALAAQDIGPSRFRIIVADNDETDDARNAIEATAGELSLNLLYRHAPARNISKARNACIDSVAAPVFAFVDDDLLPSTRWISELLEHQERCGADVVLGPVLAQYPSDSPEWARLADLHSTKPVFVPDGQIVTGYTCNVLVRTSVLEGLRFDVSLGRSGGEDTVFFARLADKGARIAYADQAIVYEPVDPARINLIWLLKRSYRSGQTHGRVLTKRGLRRWIGVPLAVAKIAYCAMAAAATIYSPPKWRSSLVRGALHAGSLSYFFGSKDIELY